MVSYTPNNTQEFEELDARKFIIIKGARANNLRNLSVAIPHNQLIVITGLSGAGKSSLAFDTLFAEGQRMYLESLSAYTRQFLGKMEKPAIDYIKGLAPAIAIEQKRHSRNPRSTVGTTTEIFDYLKLLYARIGVTYSPISGERVSHDTVAEVVDYICQQEVGAKLMVLYPLQLPLDRTLSENLSIELGKGFTRLKQNGQIYFIEDVINNPQTIDPQQAINVLVDRFVIASTHDETNQFRIADSVQTAFFEGAGTCIVEIVGKAVKIFSDRFERDGLSFEIPSANFFSFNNPYGACKTCDGLGQTLGIDENKVIPNKSLSVYEGAIVPWQTKSMHQWLEPLIAYNQDWNFPIHRPYKDLTAEEKKLLWTGYQSFKGIYQFFEYLVANTYKIQYRVLLARYQGKTICPDCQGTRIRKDASYVRIGDKAITELLLMPIEKLSDFFTHLTLASEHEQKIAARLLTEINSRLEYMQRVGLGYLTLHRPTASLSGGEYQRIKLATALGSTLVGTIYILDEPTIGLHPRDTSRLVDILVALKDAGNSVIVVEHEEEVMRAANQLIEIGPEAGTGGGYLVFQGDWNALKQFQGSHTARYLNGLEQIPWPAKTRPSQKSLILRGARANNLANVDLILPLGILTVVTGVSGSGKTTLVKKLLYPAVSNALGASLAVTNEFDTLEGDYQYIQHVELVDQNPIGKSSRSNPITYIKAYDSIRQLFAEQPLAQQRGYKPSHFSFNTDGGRCEACQGEGEIKIEMQFMADIVLTCEECHGSRFKDEILEVTYKGKDIAAILRMTVADALVFFQDHPSIRLKIQPLQEVGLGYITLGQSSNSLSGGEAQRVKLAAYLSKGPQQEHTLFIFDEPTTGLHIHDIKQLLNSIQALVDAGNSVLIIEHNMDVIKCADWIIDLGPDGGEKGGQIVFTGTPHDMLQLHNNYTAEYLKKKVAKHTLQPNLATQAAK
jgi:excinuclease ABC subunit A